jgi:NAD(P)H-dependent FMN reductase
MKILSIGGSNSYNSINRKLANYVSSLFNSTSVVNYDISKIDLQLFSIQEEITVGVHHIASNFAALIDESDLIVLSLAENNGSYNVGFKNLMDWTSRIKDRKTWGNKPMLLMSTSPGGRGGATVLEGAKNYLPFMGADIKATFKLPKFNENFDEKIGITNTGYKNEIIDLVSKIQSEI